MVAGKGARRRNLVPSTSHTLPPKDFPESQKPQTLWRILSLAKQRGTNSVGNDELQMVNNNQPETTVQGLHSQRFLRIPSLALDLGSPCSHTSTHLCVQVRTKAEYVMGVKGRSSRRSQETKFTDLCVYSYMLFLQSVRWFCTKGL